MKKTYSTIFRRITPGSIAGILALFLSASCSLGLEPARSDAGSGTLSLSLSTLPGYSPSGARTDPSGRAVVQGGGYLYIRPLGGPGGTGAKRYYGPYPIRANSTGYDLFKTTDIPGGSYDGLAVLFAASPVDTVAVTLPVRGETTLGAVLSLPDADFRAAVTADLTSGLTALDVSLDDSASFAITGATTIRPNSITNLSVTLVPATNKVLSAIEGGGVAYDRSETHRAFIRVTGLKDRFGSMSPGTASLAITTSNPLAQSVTLSAFAAYRANGSLIPGSVATNVALASGQTTRATAVWDGSDSCYLYAEFAGTALNFSFEAISGGSGAALNVSFTGTSVQGSHRAFFAVYDSDSVTLDELSDEYKPSGNPIALGMMVLDNSGSGTGTACVPATATPYPFAAGTYYVSFFVDQSGNYTDISGTEGIGVTNDIVPHFNDLVQESRTEPVVVSPSGGNVHYDVSSLVTCSDYVFFVSQSGFGSKTGNRRANAMPFDNALATIESVGAYHFYLAENITHPSPITIDNGFTLCLLSADGVQRTISLNGTTTYITVGTGGILYLENAGIDGQEYPRDRALIETSGTLIMDAGSSLINARSSGNGGAVNLLEGSVFDLKGGTIENCESSQGGGVYVNMNASLTFSGGTITNCNATNGGGSGGGGVYLDSSATMTLSGGTISACTAMNSGGYGGGIFMNGNSALTILSGRITGCNSDMSGDGIAWCTGSTITGDEGIIANVVSGNIGSEIAEVNW